MEFYLRHPSIGRVSFHSKHEIGAKNGIELFICIICKTHAELLRISTRIADVYVVSATESLQRKAARGFKLVIAHLIVQMIFT